MEDIIRYLSGLGEGHRGFEGVRSLDAPDAVTRQLIPADTRRVFCGRHANVASLGRKQVQTAVQEHAEYIHAGSIPRGYLVGSTRQTPKLRWGRKIMLGKIEDVCTALENHFYTNTHAETGKHS